MLLRQYWKIIKRRAWISIALLAIVAGTYILTSHDTTTTYSATMRFVVGIEPEVLPNDVYGYDRYYTWLTAEYLIDDLSEVVKSERFAQDIATRSGVQVPAGAISGATASGKLHRILSVSVTWPDPEQLETISSAIQEILIENPQAYLAQLGTDRGIITVIDSAHPTAIGKSLRTRLDLPIRLLLALAVGIVLEFLLDYLDPSILQPEDLEQMGITVLASIPGRKLFGG